MARFATTHWSVILGSQHSPERAREALEEICRNYRGPVLSYVLQHGYGDADAEDLTQEFFARLVEQRWDARADPARGRFRAYLLTALQRFLANQAESARAGKRGGGAPQVALDEATARAPGSQSPEQAFNRSWVLTVIEHAVHRLEREIRAAGHESLYRELAEYLVESPDSADYRRAAERLDLKPNTVAVHVHRLRQRLRELIRDELANTVSSAEDLDGELQALRGITHTDAL